MHFRRRKVLALHLLDTEFIVRIENGITIVTPLVRTLLRCCSTCLRQNRAADAQSRLSTNGTGMAPLQKDTSEVLVNIVKHFMYRCGRGIGSSHMLADASSTQMHCSLDQRELQAPKLVELVKI